ncbi:LOW QUALITY PROTEIN: phosphatidylinositol 5-phosphate 4-kinase type-2 alpha-like [Haliotis rubra]|uniref:LOW QUALITY PROTEIN: phosphatidylinositol 5-phosphate 4-kinase type-2 alpha-like n=1 Tax=Haliotis rubra TaxID=36100 RepID=UPI001EE56240|nr:LOW QUALITY PROTEIN: phosphatidylinositol 5-phosphate 4-kinase type-2 alpha-like [Haliotis rubra]
MASFKKGLSKKLKPVALNWKLFRANEPLLSVFMWGINHTVNELNHVNLRVMLMPDDFKAFSKIRVDNHMFNKDNMPSHFKVKEYCPIVFKNLRERFGIDDFEYMSSLTKQPHYIDSPGRSGARMLMSQDKKFFIKTLVSEEVEQMHHVLKQYHQYIVEKHAQTLLPQYLGMYRLTVNDVETYMVVMRNIFSPRLGIHKKYDLKGSTVDRQASDKERQKSLPTLKDVDFVNDGVTIQVGQEAKDKLMPTLTKGVEFLASLHLMDYSLIVGIRDPEKGDSDQTDLPAPGDGEGGQEEEENGLEEEMTDGYGAVPPTDSPNLPHPPFTGELDSKLEQYAIKVVKVSFNQEIYFMALIDVLTKHGMKKRTAQAAKTVKRGAGAEISAVRPDQYAKDFWNSSQEYRVSTSLQGAQCTASSQGRVLLTVVLQMNLLCKGSNCPLG